MKNAVIVNASPRKDGNTAALLQSAILGMKSMGANTELFHLYDLDFKGCTSCFACKRKDSRCNGLCAMRDDLTAVLKKILDCDCLLLGSPIYFWDVPGIMRSFLERLVFPIHPYSLTKTTTFEGKIHTGVIYTMNITEERMKQSDYESIFQKCKNLLLKFNGESEVLISNDTYQFDDYSLYEAPRYDEAHKARVKAEQFPLDCQKAFVLGARMANG
jgi:multimeric flavodoxin WrbA